MSAPVSSLARASNKRLYRESRYGTIERAWHLLDAMPETAKYSRRGWLRQHVDFLKQATGDLYIGEFDDGQPKTVKSVRTHVSLAPSKVNGGYLTRILTLNPKTFTSAMKCVDVYLSRHVMERVFQRLRIDGSQMHLAVDEIRPVIMDALKTVRPEGDFSIKSAHGLFIGTTEVHDDGGVSVALVTFVDDDKLRPEQM